MLVLLAATANRSDRPKRQLFIDLRSEADNLLPGQMLPFHFAPNCSHYERRLAPP